MIYPSINKLMKDIDSRYTLVIIAAKRARRLIDGEPKIIECNSEQPVTIAIHEIARGKVAYIRDKD